MPSAALTPPSLHALPPLPQGLQVLRLRCREWDIKRVPRGRVRRLAKAMHTTHPIGCAPVALVRVTLLRDGIPATEVDDWIVDTVAASEGVITWRNP